MMTADVVSCSSYDSVSVSATDLTVGQTNTVQLFCCYFATIGEGSTIISTVTFDCIVGVDLLLTSSNGEGSTFIITIFHLTSIQDLSLYDDQVPILYCWY